MITIQILKSPDQNVIQEFKFYQNQLYLGYSSGDLWITDPALKTSHLLLETIESDLLVHPQKEVEYYLLNGKRSSSIRKIKINDEITIGETVLKIISFDETKKESKKEILNRKLEELVNTNSPKLTVIEKLTQMMKS